MSGRMRLRRADGEVYLERWGIQHDRIGGVLLHRMSAPDPGLDLHDHPWTFVTIPLVGGYEEQRADTRLASMFATMADAAPGASHRGVIERVRPRRPRRMRLDECHRIVALSRRHVWTLVIHGPPRRRWGFYMPTTWMVHDHYGRTVRAERRDMWDEVSGAPT